MRPKIEIKKGDITTVVAISAKIPEFFNPHDSAEYEKRLKKVPSIILIAYVSDRAAGFKVGYEREGYFYSWMGGILPDFRRMGLATKLAVKQEEWAKSKGYPHVTFKTRNRLKPMLLFALNNGFNIIDVQPKETVEEYRIVLRKQL